MSGKYEQQQVLKTLSIGDYWIYNPSETGFFVGVQYRNWIDFNTHTNALIGILGTQFKNYDHTYQISVSYDFQTSGLAGSNSLGALELSFVFSSNNGLFGCKMSGPDIRDKF